MYNKWLHKFLYASTTGILAIVAICLLFPLYWTFKGSFELSVIFMKIPPRFFPSILTLINYSDLFTLYPILRWIINSAIVAGAATIISVSLTCASGYAFAKKEFPGKKYLFWTFLATMMVPSQITLIPLFILMRSLNLYDTLPGLFLPAFGVGSLLLARQFMSTIPSEFIDSAKVDGASEFGIFLHVILPLAKPLIGALCIFSFVGNWTNFLWPLIMCNSNASRTLPIGIALTTWVPGGLPHVGRAMAGASLIALPILVVFFWFQKYFTKGITLGGVKG